MNTKPNPAEFTNHSGGAEGADKMWELVGRFYGVTNHNHYRPKDLASLSVEETAMMLSAVTEASIALGRPSKFKGVELVQRNWIPTYKAEAIFAVSHIVKPNERDFKGFINSTDKQIVAGGTGWAVQMAIQMYKPVYVFDMNTNKWYYWMYSGKMFVAIATPILTENFSGIGARQLNSYGIKAIENVYEKTFK